MSGQWSEDAIRRIIRSVLHTERQTMLKIGGTDEPPRSLPLFLIVRGKAVAAVAADDPTFMINEVQALGQSAPKPDDPLSIVNVPGLTLAIGDPVYAAYNFAITVSGTGEEGTGTGDGNWEALAFTSQPSQNTGFAVCMILEDVPAMETISGTDVAFTPGALYLGGYEMVREDGLYSYGRIETVPAGTGTDPGTGDDTPAEYSKLTVLNLTMTDIRASIGEPIVALGTIEYLWADQRDGEDGTGTGSGSGPNDPERIFIVASDKDIRSYPGFDINRTGVVFQLEGERSGRLDMEECGTGTGTGS